METLFYVIFKRKYCVSDLPWDNVSSWYLSSINIVFT